MEFVNFTPFPAIAFETIDQHDQKFHVAVMRATLDMQDDGTLTYADDQLPLVMTDEFYGEPNKSSVRQESDLAPFKPKCDVIAIANAHAPSGKPAEMFVAGIRIYESMQPRPIPPRPYGLNPTMAPDPQKLVEWEKEMADIRANPMTPGKLLCSKLLMVHGLRYWRKGFLGDWNLTSVKPSNSLPIRYEYAYGGDNCINVNDPDARRIQDKHRLSPEQRKQHPDGPDQAPAAHTVCHANPLGIGYTEPWYLKAASREFIAAPLIESAKNGICEFGKEYVPEGLGVIAKTWLPRRKLCGTIDDAFIASQKPLPDDFNFAFWNCALPDLQLPYLKGDEAIQLINLLPHGTPGAKQDQYGNTLLTYSLPGHTPYLLVRYESGAMVPMAVELDTLIIEPEERRVSCVYRGLIAKEPEVRVLESRLILKEETSEVRQYG